MNRAHFERLPNTSSLRLGLPEFIGQDRPFCPFAGSLPNGPAFDPSFLFQIFAVNLYYLISFSN